MLMCLFVCVVVKQPSETRLMRRWVSVVCILAAFYDDCCRRLRRHFGDSRDRQQIVLSRCSMLSRDHDVSAWDKGFYLLPD